MINASSPDRSSEHRTEPVPPEPNRLVAIVDAPLVPDILGLSQKKRTHIITARRITSGELLK
jgi:hypothetical protein